MWMTRLQLSMTWAPSLLRTKNIRPITDVTSLLYFQPEKIKEYFGDGRDFGVNMRYVLPDEDYGTAGAVRFAVGEPDEPVLVISGDLVTDFDLGEAIELHKRKKASFSETFRNSSGMVYVS